jgi:5-methylcytosine-specific restriction endonuclease McrA
MRIRTIKPEFWTDSFMVNIDPIGRLAFMGLISAADDHGYITDDLEEIAMLIMPKEEPLVVYGWIDFFYATGKLEKHEGEGVCYYRIANWEKHQRVDRPSKSKIARESSRVLASVLATRQEVAKRHNCPEGGEVAAHCYYCGEEGQIRWHRNYLKNRPSAWVTFGGLELEKAENQILGQSDIVLACRRCNRKKGSKPFDQHMLQPVIRESSRVLASPPVRIRDQGRDQGSGNRDQGTGIREHDIVRSAPPDLNLAESIYAAYPRKVAKPAALRAINSALKTTSAADLLAKTTAYAEAVASWPDADAKFVPHPATWYNQQRYLDDPSEWRRGNTVAKTKYDDMEGKRW